MKRYKVILNYTVPVFVEAESKEEARAAAWNEGGEALLNGEFIDAPIIEQLYEVDDSDDIANLQG